MQTGNVMVRPRSPQHRKMSSSIMLQNILELCGMESGGRKYSKQRKKSPFGVRVAIIFCSVTLFIYTISYFSMINVLQKDNGSSRIPMSTILQKLAVHKDKSDIEIAIDVAANYKEPAPVAATDDDVDSERGGEYNKELEADLAIAVAAVENYVEPIAIEEEEEKVNNIKIDRAPHQLLDVLVLTTKVGKIRIVLRPDLSQDSVTYLKILAKPKTTNEPCQPCNIYRAEKPGILQGIMKHPTISSDFIQKGACPEGYDNVPNDCPAWDSSCGCHGPIMTRGMVGWAAGATGPDFFINTYDQPAKWWGTQHTIFGIILDEPSFTTITDIYNNIPTHTVDGLTHINDPIHISLSLENATIDSITH